LNSRGIIRPISRALRRAATARSDCSRCIVSARLGGGRLRRDLLDLLRVRKDEWDVSEEVLEVMEDDESAQFVRAQRVIARSKRVARVPKAPARRTEDAVEGDVEDTADPCSGEWGAECVDPSSAVERLSPRRISSSSTNASSMTISGRPCEDV
jgi:hypothetical protein